MSDVIVKIKETDLLALGALGIGFVLIARDALKKEAAAEIFSENKTPARSPEFLFMRPPTNTPTNWKPPASAAPYIAQINTAETLNNIPHNLLARLIYQESRFRHDIITGQTISSAGAMGIAQIVPKWHPSVDPLNPYEAIEYAAKYLKKLYNIFGDWRKALAAYNWGQGNVKKFISGEITRMPKETKKYIEEITRDVQV